MESPRDPLPADVSAETEPADSPSAEASFPAAGAPYLVGVITAAAQLVIPVPLTPGAPRPATHETPALPIRHAWAIA